MGCCTNLVVELAKPTKDLRVVQSAFRSFAPYIEHYYPTAHKWFTTKVIPEFKARRRRIWIASIDDIPVGIAVVKYHHPSRTELKICTLFVAPEFRGLGIGTILLAHIVEQHDREMFTSLTIRCPTNVKLILEPLLHRNGFILEEGYRRIFSSSNCEVSFLRINPFLDGKRSMIHTRFGEVS